MKCPFIRPHFFKLIFFPIISFCHIIFYSIQATDLPHDFIFFNSRNWFLRPLFPILLKCFVPYLSSDFFPPKWANCLILGLPFLFIMIYIHYILGLYMGLSTGRLINNLQTTYRYANLIIDLFLLVCVGGIFIKRSFGESENLRKIKFNIAK